MNYVSTNQREKLDFSRAKEGELLLTTSGKTMKLIYDFSEIDPTDEYPFACIYVKKGKLGKTIYRYSANGWCMNSQASQLIGYVQKEGKPISIVIKQPITYAEPNTLVYMIDVDLDDETGCIAPVIVEVTYCSVYKPMLDAGLLFRTKEDAKKFLKSLKSTLED